MSKCSDSNAIQKPKYMIKSYGFLLSKRKIHNSFEERNFKLKIEINTKRLIRKEYLNKIR